MEAISAGERAEILALIKSLPESNSVSIVVRTILSGQAVHIQTACPVLYRSLVHPKEASWQERAAAAWALGCCGLTAWDTPSATERLSDVLENMTIGKNPAPVRVMAARSLGRLAFVGRIGTLCRAACDKDRQVRTAAQAALPGLLTLLTPADEGRLDVVTQRDMLAVVRSSPDETLLLALAAALENAGSGTLWREAEEAFAAVRPWSQEIETAVQRLLAVLKARSEREHLLRPAMPPADTLLRPAACAGEPDTARLLHPVGEGEDAVQEPR